MSAPVPEDLQTWYSVACDGISFKTDHKVVKVLIERIAALEQERDQEQKLREEWRAATLAEQSKVTQLVAEKAMLISDRDQLWSEVKRLNGALQQAAKDCLTSEGTLGEVLKRVNLINEWKDIGAREVAARSKGAS